MRRYKGMKAPAKASAPRSIKIDGRFNDWTGIAPEFRDAAHDIANRDSPALVPNIRYTDSSARNDIVAAKVAHNAKTVYFSTRTASALTPPNGKSWMLLLIDADSSTRTGWHGYDLLINRSRKGNQTTLERNVASVPLRASGNQIEVAVPRKYLPKARMPKARTGLTLDFKWADNIGDAPDIMDFYSRGDVAPNARFNHRYLNAAP